MKKDGIFSSSFVANWMVKIIVYQLSFAYVIFSTHHKISSWQYPHLRNQWHKRRKKIVYLSNIPWVVISKADFASCFHLLPATPPLHVLKNPCPGQRSSSQLWCIYLILTFPFQWWWLYSKMYNQWHLHMYTYIPVPKYVFACFAFFLGSWSYP